MDEDDNNKTHFKGDVERAKIIFGSLGVAFLRLLMACFLTYPATGFVIGLWLMIVATFHGIGWGHVADTIGAILLAALLMPISGVASVCFLEIAVCLTIFFLLSGGWSWIRNSFRNDADR
jgi:hypothetical protein